MRLQHQICPQYFNDVSINGLLANWKAPCSLGTLNRASKAGVVVHEPRHLKTESLQEPFYFLHLY